MQSAHPCLPNASVRTVASMPLLPTQVRDETGFWEVVAEYPGRGMSLVTKARHTCENGVSVGHRFYQPGPYDAIAFGADSPAAIPKSTYTVYTGVLDAPDDITDETARALVLKAHPNVDAAALQAGCADVWSPDGEGALFWKFEDLQVEEALRFAQSLDAALVNA